MMDFDIDPQAVLIALRRRAAANLLLAAQLDAAIWEAVAEQEHRLRVEKEEGAP